MTRRVARLSLAIATALGVLAALALPAAAATGSITAGTISLGTVNPSESYVITIGGPPPAGAPCADDGVDPTIDITFDGSGGTLVTFLNLGKHQLQVPGSSGNWYAMKVALGTGSKAGTISGGTITQNLSLRITFHPIVNPSVDCVNDTNAVCTLQTNLTLSGSWSGGNTPPGTAVVSGGPHNVTRAGACAAPFATRFPATGTLAQATVTGLTITF